MYYTAPTGSLDTRWWGRTPLKNHPSSAQLDWASTWIYIYIYIHIRGSVKKFMSWLRYSHGLWQNKVFFQHSSPLGPHFSSDGVAVLWFHWSKQPWRADMTSSLEPFQHILVYIYIYIYMRMVWKVLSLKGSMSWRQHPTRHQLYGNLPPITKTIQVRPTRHARHCWRSRDELISGPPHMAGQN